MRSTHGCAAAPGAPSRNRATEPLMLRQLWLNLPLRDKGIIVIAIPMLALVAGLALSWSGLRAERAADERVEHARDVKEVLSETLTLLIDAENGMRGFVLTNDPAFRQSFDAALRTVPNALDDLDALIGADPAQRERLGQLRARVDERFAILKALPTTPPAGRVVGMMSGRAVMLQIRELVGRMQSDEDILLDQGQQQVAAARRVTAWRWLTASTLGAGFGIAAMVLFTRGVSGRVAELARHAASLERGETVTPMRPAADEVGQLAARLSMAASLLQAHQQEKARAQAELDQFFSLSLDMLSIISADGTFRRVNPAWTETLGWQTSELIGRPYLDFVHPDDLESSIAEAQRVAQGALATDFENRYRARDGTYRWMSWKAAPSHTRDLLYCATRDVTEARATRHELASRAAELAEANHALDLARREIQAILDHSPVNVFVTDLEGRYRILNRATLAVTGREPHTLLGKRADEIFPPAVAEQLRANAARVVAEDRAVTFEETLPTPDGLRVFSVVRFPLRDSAGHISTVCAMSMDVTETRAAAEAAQQARAEAVRANHAKTDFLSRISHELRTPLNAILGFTQLFDRERLSPEERDNVRHILEGGRHLLDLINEVIDISRVESGTLALSNEPVDIYEAIDSAVALIRPLAAAQGITVTVEASPQQSLAVVADRQRLRQVLLNLLSNAVKYNRPSGSVRVGVERSDDGRIRVSVHDTGAGIPPHQLPLLFQPFERLGAHQTSVEGTGLGLALSKALCEAMGGTLEVVSRVDHGSTFSLELAETVLAAATGVEQSATAGASPSSPPAPTSGVVVYIEDNVANVRLMERILSRRPGLTMIHSGDGRTGMATVREVQPSLVLLDLQLPEMPGDAVLRELWKDPLTRKIPVVILTADATHGLASRLLAAGARACLTKPLDVQQLLKTVDSLIGDTADAPDS
jgi:PAS domain S-box-containing protein